MPLIHLSVHIFFDYCSYIGHNNGQGFVTVSMYNYETKKFCPTKTVLALPREVTEDSLYRVAQGRKPLSCV